MRDAKLVGKMLFYLKKNLNPNNPIPLYAIKFKGYSKEAIEEHITGMYYEGLIDYSDTSSKRGFNCHVRGITPAGYKLIADTRDKSIGNRLKKSFSSTWRTVFTVALTAVITLLVNHYLGKLFPTIPSK